LIENKFGIACKDQILVYKDRILKNDLQQLCHYQIRQFSRLHVFDARDIKANADDLDCDLYGIYQEAESSPDQPYDGHHNSKHHHHHHRQKFLNRDIKNGNHHHHRRQFRK
jgi:hypothetical protein